MRRHSGIRCRRPAIPWWLRRCGCTEHHHDDGTIRRKGVFPAHLVTTSCRRRRSCDLAKARPLFRCQRLSIQVQGRGDARMIGVTARPHADLDSSTTTLLAVPGAVVQVQPLHTVPSHSDFCLPSVHLSCLKTQTQDVLRKRSRPATAKRRRPMAVTEAPLRARGGAAPEGGVPTYRRITRAAGAVRARARRRLLEPSGRRSLRGVRGTRIVLARAFGRRHATCAAISVPLGARF